MRNTFFNNNNNLSSSFQTSMVVWKSPVWYGVANYAPWCAGAFFIFVGLVALAEKRDAQHAPIIFLAALLCIMTIVPLRKLGKTVIKLGIDSKSNTFLISRQGLVSFESNADSVREFSFKRFEYTRINPVWKFGSPQPLFFKNYKWLLIYMRAHNSNFWEFKGVSFATESDARAIAAGANELLRSYMGISIKDRCG